MPAAAAREFSFGVNRGRPQVKMDHMRRVVEFHPSACLTGEFAYCIRRLKTISVRLVRSGKMHLRLPALQATEDVTMHGCERMTWGSLAAVLSETGLDCCHPPSHGPTIHSVRSHRMHPH